MPQVEEPVLVQTFVPEATVERLDVCVLIWLARLDQAQLHAMVVRPLQHGSAGELLAVVGTDDFRIATTGTDPIQHTNEMMAAKGVFSMGGD